MNVEHVEAPRLVTVQTRRSVGRRRRIAPVGMLLAAAVSLSSCGYSLAGRGSFLPAYIKTVGVPQFINRSATIFDLDRTLTDAVRSELTNRGRRAVANIDGADVDAVLTGTILSVTQQPTAFNSSQQATRLAVTILASVEFKDLHTGKVLWSSPAVQGRDEYDIASGGNASDLNTFFGQNASALQRLAQAFARSVVTSVLENF